MEKNIVRGRRINKNTVRMIYLSTTTRTNPTPNTTPLRFTYHWLRTDSNSHVLDKIAIARSKCFFTFVVGANLPI
jgi:hypothetical protein